MKITAAFHTKAKVSPDQKIEIQAPDLPVGETVDVFIVFQKQAEPKRSSILKMIEEIRSHRKTFTDAEETNVVSEEDKEDPSSTLDFLDQLPGQRQFKTAAEIDQYLREERDSWDS